jgi:hypothetical protein
MIELRALGSSEIGTGVTTLTPSHRIVFAAALYLVLERGKPVSRSRFASLLWPNAADKTRAHRLRQTILQLKKVGVVVRADRDNVQLSQHDARSDVDALPPTDALLPNGLASFEFLPGYDPRFSEPFRDWVDAKRVEAHAAVTRILVRSLRNARSRGDWVGVERFALQCLVLDQFNEVAVLAQAEGAAMCGGKRRAVAILDRYIDEVGSSRPELKLPATLLRRRVAEQIPEGDIPQIADSPLVGRETEMETLVRAFQTAKTGRGSTALLVGEPGIGKSRLSDELSRFAELQGAQVQRTARRRTDLQRPLSLFVDIVPQLREMPGALGCAPETFASLKRLTDFELRPRENSPSLDSEMLFDDVRRALFDLLESLVDERCLVIAIDDIHWLDDASSKILGAMTEWAPTKRVFFLLNSRTIEGSLSRYADAARINTLLLRPLEPVASESVLQFIASHTSDQTEPDFFEWCIGVAEGNPFFLQELAHHWLETGHKYEAPPSVTKVLQRRLARLSVEALQVLQCSAVLGEHATLERVERVFEYSPHQLLSAVEELSKAAMLGTDQVGGLLRPRHDLLASAAVNRLAQVSLGFIHRRAAEVLEKEIARESMSTTLLWACATHRHGAGDRQKALALSVSCAEHLLDVGLAGDASGAFQKSLDYCATDDQRLEVLPRLAVAFQLNGEWEKTKDALRTGMRLAGRAAPASSPHNEFELLLFAARHQSGLDFCSLLADIIPCVESIAAPPAHRVRAAALALKLATDIGPDKTLDDIYAHVAPLLRQNEVPEISRLEVEIIYRTMRGREAIPVKDLGHFAETARITGGEIAYSNALLTASAACRITARYEEGLAFVAQAFEHATSHKRGARLSHVLVAELRLHVAGGAYDRAESALHRMIECLISPDDTFAQSELQFYKTRIALEKGDLQRASTMFSTVQEVPQTYSARRRAHSLALGLRIRLTENPRDDELQRLVLNLEIEHLRIRSLGDQDFEAYALYLGLCAIGDRTRALDLLTDYVTVHRRSEWPLPAEIASTVHLNAQMSTEVKTVDNLDDELRSRFRRKLGQAGVS